MTEEQPKNISIQIYVDLVLYNELITMKRNRTWAEFLREDLVLRKPVTEAIQAMNLIQEQEKSIDTSKVDMRAEPCEVCGIEYKITDLTELPNSKKLLCKDCLALFNKPA